MDAVTPWITPALVIALGAWLRVDLRGLRREMNDLAGSMNERFDQVNRELADLRERMARLEGSLDGRRDRDAA